LADALLLAGSLDKVCALRSGILLSPPILPASACRFSVPCVRAIATAPYFLFDVMREQGLTTQPSQAL
jgi:hypothetical protein